MLAVHLAMDVSLPKKVPIVVTGRLTPGGIDEIRELDLLFVLVEMARLYVLMG